MLEAGKAHGAGPVGARALNSLRIEKGYGSWSREYSPELWPHEVGLDALCKLDKDFLNRDAARAVIQRPARERLVMLALDEADTTASNADASGGEPIFCDDEPVGYVTSGAYGYSVGMSLALGFVRNVQMTDVVQVMVLGKPHRATVLAQPPFDPAGERLRA